MKKLLIDNIIPAHQDGAVSNMIGPKATHEMSKTILRQLSEMVALTLGPGGNSVLLSSEVGRPYSTKDGLTVLQHIQYMGDGASTVKQLIERLAERIVEKVGDGSSSSIVAANALYEIFTENEELKDYRPKQILNTLEKIKNEIINELEKEAKPLEVNSKELLDLCTVSLNNDIKDAKIIEEAYNCAGKDGFLTINMTSKDTTSVKSTQGFTIPAGFLDKIQINEPSRGENILENVDIVMFDAPLLELSIAEHVDALFKTYTAHWIECDKTGAQPRSLLMIAPSYGKLLNDYFSNYYRQMFENNIVPRMNIIALSRTGENNAETYEDVAIKTGAHIILNSISQEKGINWSTLEVPEHIEFFDNVNQNTPDKFLESLEPVTDIAHRNDPILGFVGHCEKVVSTQEQTVFYGCTKCDEIILGNRKREIKERMEKCKAKNEEGMLDLYKLRKRLARLNDNLVSIEIGGLTEQERLARKDLFNDALLASKSALEFGYISGGHLTTLNIINKLKLKETDPLRFEVLKGFSDALYTVLETILENTTLSEKETKDILDESWKKGMLVDITGENKSIINSVRTDIEILNGLCSIIGMLYTSKGILTNSTMNTYVINK